MNADAKSKVTVGLDFRSAGYIWLKKVNASDHQQTVETLLAILGWLTGPGIENVLTCEELNLFTGRLL